MVRKPPSKIPEKAAGLSALLSEKSRDRRHQFRQLTEIATHVLAAPRRNDLLPPLQLISMPVSSLKPASRRVRKSEPAQKARIDASTTRFGYCDPILIDQHNTIIDGHLRWELAKEKGWAEITCIRVDHLTDTDVRMLRIALNRIGERGSWSTDDLKIEIQQLTLMGEDVVLTGFDEAEIDILLLEECSDINETDEDGIGLGSAEACVSRPGDIWILGPHRLLQDDARDPVSYERLMEGEQARLILTDVPYNVPNVGHVTSDGRHREFAMAAGEMSAAEFAAFNRQWMSSAASFLVDGGLIGTTIDWRSVEIILATGRELGFDLLNLIVWAKSNAGQGSLYRSQHELLPLFKKGKAAHVNNIELGRHGRWRSNVWDYPGGSSLGSDAREGLKDHPTVKPRAMIEDALLDVTHRGDIVVDCFAGSGTTVLAAEATGRVCRAIEIDGPYCDVIVRRWQAMTGEDAVLLGCGDSFEVVRQRRLGAAATAVVVRSVGG